MKFEDAVVKAVKMYREGHLPENLIKALGKDITYTPEWFDQFEKDALKKRSKTEKMDMETEDGE